MNEFNFNTILKSIGDFFGGYTNSEIITIFIFIAFVISFLLNIRFMFRISHLKKLKEYETTRLNLYNEDFLPVLKEDLVEGHNFKFNIIAAGVENLGALRAQHGEEIIVPVTNYIYNEFTKLFQLNNDYIIQNSYSDLYIFLNTTSNKDSEKVTKQTLEKLRVIIQEGFKNNVNLPGFSEPIEIKLAFGVSFYNNQDFETQQSQASQAYIYAKDIEERVVDYSTLYVVE